MYSKRFDRSVVVTRHAQTRMDERSASSALLLDVIDTGEIRHRDASHCWVYKYFDDRSDNLLCAVLVLEDSVVVKTFMHHFEVTGA
jgi:hypothetical protein